MIWDFVDVNPFAGAGGDFDGIVDGTFKTLVGLPLSPVAQAYQLDSAAALPDIGDPIVCTDPPYYDNIGYADLSDFFYVWLRKGLGQIWPGLFATVLTPKAQELIASPYRHNGDTEKAKRFFEHGLGLAFGRIRSAHHREYPLAVYYAFKQAESEDYDDDEANDATPVASTGWELCWQE